MLSLWICAFYCLHPKDDGRLYFQSVHTLERGSQVQVGGYLVSHPGGVPSVRSGGMGVPGVRSRGGTRSQ